MAQPSWQIYQTGTSNTLIAVDLVSPKVVWAVGGGFNGATNDGTVVRTVNGGETWENVTPPGGTTQIIRDVKAFDTRHAVVLASSTLNDGVSNAGPARISRTDDGGAHWETVFNANTSDYDSMAFFNRHHGLAFGDPVDGKFPIVATHDGGGTWALVEPIEIPIALPNEFGRATGTSLVAMGSGDAWFGTNPENDPGARVFHTRDRGTTWKVVTTPIPGGPNGIVSLSFRGLKHGLAVGGKAPPAPFTEQGVGVAARTSNGGNTWSAVGPLGGFRNSVVWIRGIPNTAVAVGPAGSDVSHDEGETWKEIDDSPFLLGIACRSKKSCWAVGQGGIAARLTI
jgi:photosystem II stability/assembly factor-like uncharacterized protein